MLENVKADVSSRINELKQIQIHIIDLQKSASSSIPTTPIQANIIKGLYFVQLYSALEFTVTALAQETLSYIDAQNITTNSFKPLLLSIILDSKCNSLESGNGKKCWDRRRNLFREIEEDNNIPIDITILPTGNGNLKYGQLKMLFDIMCIYNDPIPDKRLIGRLEELVENRNKIAHGRESSQIVGSRYTLDDLTKIQNDVIEICLYLIDVFEEYLKNEIYRK